MSMKAIADAIKENRPHLLQTTLNTYLSCISKVANSIDKPLATPDDLVENYELILDTMKDWKVSIRQTKIAAIIVAIDTRYINKEKEQSPELIEALKAYRDQMAIDSKASNKKKLKQNLSDSQKENMIPWTDVLAKYELMKKRAMPLFKVARLDKKEFFELQDFVILSCYVLIPPRRSQDYCDFKIRNIDLAKDNYMLCPNARKEAQFVFNSYKNASRSGAQKLTIPNELKKIILDWTKKNPYDYLIVNRLGGKIIQNKLTLILNNIFGKKMATSLLRHSFATHEVGDIDLQALHDTAEAMGQSDITTLLSYVQKNENELNES